MMSLPSDLSLVAELYNPLYLLPIVGVLFTAFLVFAFGFKSSTQPSDEVFNALNDRHNKNHKFQEQTIKKKKPNIQKTTNTKNEPNGHINDGLNKSNDKKTQKSKSVSDQTITSKSTQKQINNVSKSNVKKVIKNKSVDKEDIEDKNAGEWVELVSKKERKQRKQKEEQLLTDTQETIKKSKKTNKSPEKSPIKENKKNKDNKINKKVDLNSNVELDSKVKEKNVINEEKKTIEEIINTENEVNDEVIASEVPDSYEMAKEQRGCKKWQKRNQKRSESDSITKTELSIASETKTNLDVSDKLTAAIVANYESNDQNRPDSNSSANNKKKKDNKKKKIQNNNQTNSESIDTNKSLEINDSKSVETTNKLNAINLLDITDEVKPPQEEEEFKSVQSRKRRPRRE
ncbi:uncharacterized protein LOC128953009 [Oppia nitens]|uniref:uncharacterized protein LOC128953009 n=1 Tax=Oppia nitens TaxID=1686743 RepID=UPI0023DA6E0D|nr:uncharacterized protein LOC128953009 [Oppia nitens]XP_054154474.1 uncharacterized protein LOC128953009 [Oppia nitens]